MLHATPHTPGALSRRAAFFVVVQFTSPVSGNSMMVVKFSMAITDQHDALDLQPARRGGPRGGAL